MVKKRTMLVGVLSGQEYSGFEDLPIKTEIKVVSNKTVKHNNPFDQRYLHKVERFINKGKMKEEFNERVEHDKPLHRYSELVQHSEIKKESKQEHNEVLKDNNPFDQRYVETDYQFKTKIEDEQVPNVTLTYDVFKEEKLISFEEYEIKHEIQETSEDLHDDNYLEDGHFKTVSDYEFKKEIKNEPNSTSNNYSSFGQDYAEKNVEFEFKKENTTDTTNDDNCSSPNKKRIFEKEIVEKNEQCKLCLKNFENPSDFLNHFVDCSSSHKRSKLEKELGGTNEQCKICLKNFKMPSDFLNHLIDCSSSNKRRKLLEEELKESKEHRTNKKNKSRGRKEQCKICLKNFATPSDVLSHLRNNCSSTNKRRELVNESRRRKEQCKICLKDFKKPSHAASDVAAKPPFALGSQAQGLDWTCPTCGNWNFGWRIRCKPCECTRPESIDDTIKKQVLGQKNEGSFDDQDDNRAACNDFKNGDCTRPNCKFSHKPHNTDNAPICLDFQTGECTRKNCKFGHRIAGGNEQDFRPVCNDFKNGYCARQNCRFSHEVPGQTGDPESNGPCYDFQTGDCTRRNCKFSHKIMGGNEEAVRPMCNDFKNGDCSKQNCRFSHTDNRPICLDFQNGDCSRRNCKFSHRYPTVTDENGEIRPLCNDFQTGKCSRHNCKFSHDIPKLQVCGDFQSGNCSRGDRCRFAHRIRKKEVCKDFTMGRCSRTEEQCRFIHGHPTIPDPKAPKPSLGGSAPQGPAGWDQSAGGLQHNAFTPIWPVVPTQERKQAQEQGNPASAGGTPSWPPASFPGAGWPTFPGPAGSLPGLGGSTSTEPAIPGYEQFSQNAPTSANPAMQAVMDKVTEATTPLSNIPYPEQINRKTEEARWVAEQMGTEVLAANPTTRSWVDVQSSEYGCLAKLEQVKESPVLEGYRNKCEFAVGLNPQTGDLTVGFKLDPRSGKCEVGPVDHLKHVPPHMKLVVGLLQSYLRGTPYGHFDYQTGLGNWVSAVVRLTQKRQTMLILNFVPQTLTADEIATLKSGLVAHWSRGPGSQAAISSLYLATKSRTGPGEMECLLGQETITETLPGNGIQMRISPRAYFCINTPGASLLVDSVARLAGLNSEDTLLDICCGTGTLGLSLASRCGAVLGVDILPEVIEEARKNAEFNNIQNTLYFDGPAEDVLPSMVRQATGGRPIVAVVDPPRTGLPLKAVRELRASRVNRIVFVASDPRASLKSMADLTRPSSATFSGDPFLPLLLQPLDLFPHTTHYIMLVLFARVPQADLLYPHRANMDHYLGHTNVPDNMGKNPIPEQSPITNRQNPGNRQQNQGYNNQQNPGMPGQSPANNWQNPQNPYNPTPARQNPPTPNKQPSASKEASLSGEQKAWLKQMVDMYGPTFSRTEWVDKFVKDNHEAALKQQQQQQQTSSPVAPAPPPATRRPPSPEIPPMPPFPVAPTSQDPDEYARYKANYDAYSAWYTQYGAAYAAKQEAKAKGSFQPKPVASGSDSGNSTPKKELPDPNKVPPGTDPQAWAKYCQETRDYYAKYNVNPANNDNGQRAGWGGY